MRFSEDCMELSKECYTAVQYIIQKINEYNSDKEYSQQIFNYNVNRIQRILYFSQVLYMHKNKVAMFEDDFYAWPKGPVVIPLYDMHLQDIPLIFVQIDADKSEVIDVVLECTNSMDTTDLEKLSRVNGSPWTKFYNPNSKFDLHLDIIPKNSILEYSKYNNDIIKFLDLKKREIKDSKMKTLIKRCKINQKNQ